MSHSSVIVLFVFYLYLQFVISFDYNIDIDRNDVEYDNKIRQRYEPTWDSLDKRPLPQWYDDAKVGIFLHWGVYSVPSYGSEWFWTDWQGQKIPSYIDFMKKNYRPGFTYQEFAKDFTAELFNATQWALLFQDSGARYVVLTSKHHDGFALWPSTRSFSWNAKDVGPGIDIIGELSAAIREKTSIRFGLYYSLFEWFNRLYVQDKLHIFLQNKYVQEKVLPELHELVTNYSPEVIWSDGDWEAPPPYWNSTDFIAWLYNDSPVRDTVVTNDRWGLATNCLHGDFHTCSDRFNPVLIQHSLGVVMPHSSVVVLSLLYLYLQFVISLNYNIDFDHSDAKYENKIRQRYEPTWDSLDKRPLPQWYDDAKVGIFLHWGVYSVPSYGSEWFWNYWQGQKIPSYIDFMNKNYRPGFTYQEFAKDFTAELFNATQWALLFQDSGARYVVLTSKHHEGFALWPSTRSFSWNAKDVGPGIDIIGELSTAIREKTSIRFGLYYSLFEWFNRLYVQDKLHIFLQNKYVQDKVLPELHELVTNYSPEVIWSDGDADAPSSYWNSTDFIAWLYNDSPVRDTVVTNDRWGSATHCLHGDFHTCSDRFNPGVLQDHKWENAFTLDKTSWGQRFDTTLADYMTSKELIKELVTTVSCGGNILVNVGPTKYGTIQPIFEERLRDMGRWLSVNGEAIYESQPWLFQNDTVTPGVWYTSKPSPTGGTNVYATVLDYPYDENEIELYSLRAVVDGSTKIVLLGMPNTSIKWGLKKTSVHIQFPAKHLVDKNKLDLAWTFKIFVQK